MSKVFLGISSLCVLALCFGAGLVRAETPEFQGVEKMMSPQKFQEAGLNKLTPEERARLDDFIRGYAKSTNQVAAQSAVDAAVKDNKIAAQPQVIESNIVGPFTGYTGRSRFMLANGQVWAQSQGDTRAYPPSDSPAVIIVKAGWGHRMYVLGGGNIRVTKVK
ncbi:MAG: hypothetical protein ACR2ID_02755 [Chthoniobacterales bacterium]